VEVLLPGSRRPPTATIPTLNPLIWSSLDSTLPEFESVFELPPNGELLPPMICHASRALLSGGGE
jgi:hypothetical protein